MALADASILIAPDATGSAAAFRTIGGKVHQAVVLVDDDGHAAGTAPTYTLYIPHSAAAANKVWFDLFNAAGSGKTLRIKSVEAIKDGSVAVTGTLSIELWLTRTSAVGTGGTAATSEGSSLTAATFSKHNPADVALPAQVTARAVPTGGATAGAVLGEAHIFPEETNAATYGANSGQFIAPGTVIRVPEGTGIRVVQGAVASVGNLAHRVVIEAV